LIESIFSKIGKTLPDLFTAPKLASTEMEATVESMYRISRALEQTDINGYNLKDKDGINNFVNDISKITQDIEITGEEKKLLDDLKNKATEPIRGYIKRRDTGNLKSKYGLE